MTKKFRTIPHLPDALRMIECLASHVASFLANVIRSQPRACNSHVT